MHLTRLIQDLSQLAFLLLVWNPPIKFPLSLHLFDSEQVQHLWLFQHTVACTTMISSSLEYVVPIIKKEINKCLFHKNTSNCWKQGIITHTDRAESKQAYQWGKSKKLTSWYFYICQLQRVCCLLTVVCSGTEMYKGDIMDRTSKQTPATAHTSNSESRELPRPRTLHLTQGWGHYTLHRNNKIHIK